MLEKLMYWSWLPIVQLYIWLHLKLDVIRHQPLPPGPKIIVANHPTTLDPYFVSRLIQEPARILIIYLAFRIPVLGPWLRLGGHIEVAPGEGRRAFDAALAALAEGKNIMIFPEGDLSPSKGPGKAHNGAARLALLSGAPVIPLGIHLPPNGIRQVSGEIGGESTITRWPRHTPYAVTVGESIAFAGDATDRERVQAVTDEIMRHIRSLAQESKARLQPQPVTPRGLVQSVRLPEG